MIYSSIPLDFYRGFPGYRPNFENIYAPNVLAYAATNPLGGLTAVSTNPADGSTVGSTPTQYIVNVSDPLNTATLDAVDFQVNGNPASGYSYTAGSTSITFTFATDPVTTQGLQTMHVALDAFTRTSDGDGVSEFNGTFRYDALLLQVTSTAPTNGSVVELPFTTLDLNFNEAYKFASAAPSDFTLNQGSVTGVSQVDLDTLRLTLGGVNSEGTLTVAMPAGAMTDVFDNPGAAFSGSYILDFGIVPYPVPLEPEAPAGSLIYDPSITGVINPGSDTDSFTIDVDAGQTITVLVKPDAGLQPTIELYDPPDPSSTLIGSVSAGSAGVEAVLQTIAATTAGTYTITVGGAGTTGDYTVQVILNAALEDESHGGLTNDTLPDAQDINGSFIDLTTGTAQRGAVLGRVGRGFYGVDRFSGRLRQYDPDTGAVQGSVSMTVGGNSVFAAYGLAVDPTTNVVYALVSYSGVNTALVTLDIATGVGTAIADVNAAGQRFTEIAFDSAGTLYGLTGDSGANANSLFSINKTNGVRTFLTALPYFGGGTGESLAYNPDDGLLYRFQAGTFQSIDPNNSFAVTDIPTSGSNPYYSQAMTYVGGGQFRLARFADLYSLTTAGVLTFLGHMENDSSRIHGLALVGSDTVDFYSFTLAANQTATLAVEGAGSALELIDSSGTVLALGVTAENVSQVIGNFTAPSTPSSDTYYVRVTRSSVGDYSLVVTRDAGFDTEGNNNLASAQELSGNEVALGALTAGSSQAFATGNNGTYLISIDQATGLGAYVGPFGFSDAYAGAATPDGTFYTIVNGFDSSTSRLATVDLVTGVATIVGPLNGPGSPIISLEADASGNLYAGDWNGTFYSVNKTTGQVTPIGSMGLYYVMDFTFDNSGTLWAVDGSNQLWTVDTATGAGTYVSSISVGSVMGLLVDPADGSFYCTTYTSASILYHLDPTTGIATAVGSGLGIYYAHGGDFQALEADSDWYSISVNALDELSISTRTPAGDPQEPFEFHNLLDPAIELYDPSGTPVAANDNGGADVKNASLTYSALTSGTYYVRVLGSGGTTGEYVFSVLGATGAAPSFHVSAVDPPEGFRTRFSPPTQVTVDFNDSILLPTLQADDLTVDGVVATGLTVVDGNTVIFYIDESDEGTHDVHIAAGAIQDLQGTPLDEFTSHYTIDLTPPTVVASSIQEGDVLPAGSLSYQVTFSEAMNTDNLDAADFLLHGNIRGVDYGPSSFSFDVTGTILTINYTNLPDDSYQLTLYSGDGAFEDVVGWDLDGEVRGGGYASSVIDFSSEYSNTDWSAAQALGLPNTLSYGDIATAWAPFEQNGFSEYLTLEFNTLVYADGVSIRETNGNGFVTQVDVVDESDVLHTVWTGVDPSQPGTPVEFFASWPVTNYLVKGVRIYVDTDHDLSTWEEIDAVRIHPFASDPLVYGDGVEGGNFLLGFYLDVDAAGPADYPTPLTPVAPLGSLIYDPTVTNTISPAGDTDTYALDVDAGQTITVVVQSAAIQGTISVYDPDGNLLGSMSASAIGQDAVLQTVATDAGGTYTITVGDASGSTGLYTARVILNAAVEDESHGGSTNDTLPTAQDINASFIDLTTTTSQRGAVLGQVGSSLYGVDRFSGVLRQYDAATGAVQGSIFMIVGGISVDAAFGLAVDPTTNVVYALVSYSGVNTALVTLDVDTGVGIFIADVNAAGQRFTDMAFDSAGTLYGLTGDREADANSLFSIDKANGALSLLTALPHFGGATGESLAYNPDDGLLYRFQAGTFQSIDPNNSFAVTNIPTSGDNPYYSQAMTYVGGGQFRLASFANLYSLTTADELTFVAALASDSSRIHGLALVGNAIDMYSFTLAANQTTTLAVDGDGSTLELLDSGGIVLASGVAAENVSQIISNFTATSTDTYYVRVTRSSLDDYSLIVTRDATFDTENNDDPAHAQELLAGRTGGALGAIYAPSEVQMGQSFEGLDANGSGGYRPPDTNAAVGNNFVVETVNIQIRIFDKTSGDVLLDESLGSFFGAFSGGDPYVVYDDIADRWYVSAFDSSYSGLFLAVSDDGNPVDGSWTTYELTDVGGFPDYQKLGFNKDAIFISYNDFGGGGAAATIASIDKAAALTGTLSYFVSHPNFQFRAMPPAQMHGDTTGGVEWFVSTDGTDAGGNTIRVTKLTNYLSNSPVFTYTSLPVTQYQSAYAADQPGGGVTVFPNTTTYQVQYRNGHLVTAMASATASDGFAYPKGLYYQIDVSSGTPTLLQEGVIDPGAGVAVQMPSVDEDIYGNLGFSWIESSSSEYLSMWVGTLDTSGNFASSVVAAGGGYFAYNDRIGDYSTTVLDPSDGTTFWSANEYIGNDGYYNIWRTHIASFTVVPPVDEDWYAVDVGADHVLRFATSTPADGSGEFRNLLNPHIELYDPDGNLVASGVILGDGRNERIEYEALTAGTYRVRVISENGTQGEYFMSATADAPLTASGVDVSGVRGQPLDDVLVANFTDADPGSMLGDFTATIDWGDGTSSDGVIEDLGGGVYAVHGDHTYAAEGSYPVSVVILDVLGSTATAASTATISIVALQTDACDPTKMALVVGGTLGNDHIQFTPDGNSGDVRVKVNGVSLGSFHFTGRIIAYGQAGDDNIEVAGSITKSAWLYGGDGDDRLNGGNGPNVLLGGAGNDKLIGGSNRDLMIGGTGSDSIIGNASEDLLIAGTTAFDAREEALCAIMDEWISGRSYIDRVANVSGTGSGPRLNEDYFLKATGPDQTVFDDDDKDTLTGSAGTDWFFANFEGDGVLDKITDFVNGETEEDL